MGTYYAVASNLRFKKDTGVDVSMRDLALGNGDAVSGARLMAIMNESDPERNQKMRDALDRLTVRGGMNEDWNGVVITEDEESLTIRANGDSKNVNPLILAIALQRLLPYMDCANGDILAKISCEVGGWKTVLVHHKGEVNIVEIPRYYETTDGEYVNDGDHPKHSSFDETQMERLWKYIDFWPKAKARAEKEPEQQDGWGRW